AACYRAAARARARPTRGTGASGSFTTSCRQRQLAFGGELHRSLDDFALRGLDFGEPLRRRRAEVVAQRRTGALRQRREEVLAQFGGRGLQRDDEHFRLDRAEQATHLARRDPLQILEREHRIAYAGSALLVALGDRGEQLVTIGAR